MLSLDHGAVFQASLSMASFLLNTELPSVTHMLQAGRPVMALSSLLYGPNTLSQVRICSLLLRYSSSQADIERKHDETN